MIELNSIGQDVRFALRTFRGRPWFVGIVVCTIGMAMAANATVFSLANALFLRSLPVPDPSRWVSVYSTVDGDGSFLLSYPEYLAMLDEPVVEDAVAHAMTSMVGEQNGTPLALTAEIVSPNYFGSLEVSLARGVDVLEQPASEQDAIVISHRFWNHHFGGDDRALGSNMTLNGREFVIGGVAPESFVGTFNGLAIDLWVSVRQFDDVMPVSDTLQSQRSRRFDVTALLAHGINMTSAREAMSSLASRTANLTASDEQRRGYLVTSPIGIRPGMRGPVTVFVVMMAGVVSLVLIIACANVAGMFLMRNAERRTEFAIRAAMGASRGRMIRQLWTESILLGSAGGLIGLLAVSWIDPVLRRYQPDAGIPVYLDLTPDWRVATFVLVLLMGASLFFAVVPAIRGTASTMSSTLRVGGSMASRSALRSMLITLQLSLALALLIGTGLILKSIVASRRASAEFDMNRVVVGTVDLDLLQFEADAGLDRFRQIIRAVETVPGVEASALARFMPLASQSDRFVVHHHGSPGLVPFEVYYNVVTPAYFETMGIPILLGRDFRSDESDPVVIVNETMARFLGVESVGSDLILNGRGADSLQVRVIAVVGDIQYRTALEPPRPYLYVPHAQNYRGLMTVHARTNADPASVVQPVVRAVRQVEQRSTVTNAGPIRDVMRFVQVSQRVTGILFLVTSMGAIAMSVVGLYGFIAFAVRQKQREVGLRVALGARAGNIVQLVFRMATSHLLFSVIGGSLLGFGISRVLTRFVSGLSGFDLGVYLLVVLAVLLTYACATLPSALRAARVDAVGALRHE